MACMLAGGLVSCNTSISEKNSTPSSIVRLGHTVWLFLPPADLLEQIRRLLPRPLGNFTRALGNGCLNVSEEGDELLLATLDDRAWRRHRVAAGFWSDDGRPRWVWKALSRRAEEVHICKFSDPSRHIAELSAPFCASVHLSVGSTLLFFAQRYFLFAKEQNKRFCKH